MPLSFALLTTLVTAFLVPFHATPAEAAASCLGHRATIVGKQDGSVTGSPGRDVIVTHGARRVRAFGGDDLICVDGAQEVTIYVDAGGGDDDTFVSDRHTRVDFRSGTGSDSYESIGATDFVTILDDGHDEVSTGRRADFVTVAPSHQPGSLRVRLGGSNDRLTLPMGRSSGDFDGGPGVNVLELEHRSQQAWTIDNRHGEARAGSEVRFRWSEFEWFVVQRLEVPRIRFIGSDAAETIDAGRSATAVQLALGGGDDRAWAGKSDDTIDGGPGTDWAAAQAGTDTCISVEEAYDCETTSRTR